MQIIIPMTGYGTRFKDAGYSVLKPLIQVHNKSIIEWIVCMFSDEDDVIFVCREDHLRDVANMEKELKRIRPSATIFAIKDWVKKGPVYDVMLAQEVINNEVETIVNYCDFYMHWDYQDFRKTIKNECPDGAIVCYKGFHPHLIPKKNVYASCKVDKDNYLMEIKEKFSFERNPMEAIHSVGMYYFKRGNLLKTYYQRQIDGEMLFKGEYYSSLTYNLLCQDGLKTYVYDEVSHFCQWGTPEDLEEYLFWVKHIEKFNQGR